MTKNGTELRIGCVFGILCLYDRVLNRPLYFRKQGLFFRNYQGCAGYFNL